MKLDYEMILMLDLCSSYEEFRFFKLKEKLLFWCYQYKKEIAQSVRIWRKHLV